MGRPRKYQTEEERRAARIESKRRYRKTHKAPLDEYRRKWYEAHKEEMAAWRREHRDEQSEYMKKWYKENKEHVKEYHQSMFGRACNQRNGYRTMDILRGFGDVIDFDGQWIVDNIYSQPCAHCGETDWRKLGCNRLDNSKPHTKDNVEPCCWDCNNRLGYEARRKNKRI